MRVHRRWKKYYSHRSRYFSTVHIMLWIPRSFAATAVSYRIPTEPCHFNTLTIIIIVVEPTAYVRNARVRVLMSETHKIEFYQTVRITQPVHNALVRDIRRARSSRKRRTLLTHIRIYVHLVCRRLSYWRRSKKKKKNRISSFYPQFDWRGV